MKGALRESQRCGKRATRRCRISSDNLGRVIRPYERDGSKPDEVLGNLFGKKLIKRYFVNPETGHIEEYGLFGQKDWSVVMNVTTNGTVLIVTQFKQGVEAIVTELPAGTADWKTEKPDATAKREFEFETGHRPGETLALGKHPIASRGSWTHFHTFVTLGCEPNENGAAWDKREQIVAQAVPLLTFMKMIYDGRINEPSAIVAWTLSVPHLLKRGILDPRDYLAALEACGDAR